MRELAEAFTPTTDEIAWAQGKTQHDQYLLALLVRLKCYQRLGYVAKLADVPGTIVDRVHGVLEMPTTVVAETDAERTAKRTLSSCVSTWASSTRPRGCGRWPSHRGQSARGRGLPG